MHVRGGWMQVGLHGRVWAILRGHGPDGGIPARPHHLGQLGGPQPRSSQDPCLLPVHVAHALQVSIFFTRDEPCLVSVHRATLAASDPCPDAHLHVQARVVFFSIHSSVRSFSFFLLGPFCDVRCTNQLEGMAQPGIEELLRRDGTGDWAELDRSGPGLGPGAGDPVRAAGHEEPGPSPRHHGAVGDAQGRAPIGVQRRLLAGAACQPRRRRLR